MNHHSDSDEGFDHEVVITVTNELPTNAFESSMDDHNLTTNFHIGFGFAYVTGVFQGRVTESAELTHLTIGYLTVTGGVGITVDVIGYITIVEDLDQFFIGKCALDE